MTMNKTRGFTLFELMVTLAVAGILAAFAVPAFQQMQVNSSVSALAADLVQTINDSRSRAVSTRNLVFVLQGTGASDTDVSTVTAGDWSSGWRITRGATLATSTMVARKERGLSRLSNDGSNAVRSFFYGGTAVVASSNGAITGGTAMNAFGFNNFGRMVKSDGTQVASIVIVVCAPNTSRERGRVITLAGMGRVTNTVVQNPATCS